MEASTSSAEEKEKYVPEWDVTPDAEVGEPGLTMNFFQYCFTSEIKKEIEKVSTDVLISDVYRQRFEVSVGLILLVTYCVVECDLRNLFLSGTTFGDSAS